MCALFKFHFCFCVWVRPPPWRKSRTLWLKPDSSEHTSVLALQWGLEHLGSMAVAAYLSKIHTDVTVAVLEVTKNLEDPVTNQTDLIQNIPSFYCSWRWLSWQCGGRQIVWRSRFTVAVLEAGNDDSAHLENKIPIVCHTAQNTVYDWAYRTVPQEKSCKGLKNNVRRSLFILNRTFSVTMQCTKKGQRD